MPLSKIKGSSSATVQDIRPIMVKSHLYKIMEKTLLNKIKQRGSSLLHSSSYQNGFKENRSTGNDLATVVKRIHGRGRNAR